MERVGVVELCLLHWGPLLKLHSQLEKEGAARFACLDVIEVASNIDCNLFADVQTQAMRISLIWIGTGWFEQPSLLLLCEALSLILDQDAQSLNVVLLHRATNQRDRDLVVRFGKLNGISDQVYNDLLYAQLVSEHLRVRLTETVVRVGIDHLNRELLWLKLGHENVRDRLDNVGHHAVLAKLRLEHVETQQAIIKRGLDLRLHELGCVLDSPAEVSLLIAINGRVIKALNHLGNAPEWSQHFMCNCAVHGDVHLVRCLEFLNLSNLAHVIKRVHFALTIVELESLNLGLISANFDIGADNSSGLILNCRFSLENEVFESNSTELFLLRIFIIDDD